MFMWIFIYLLFGIFMLNFLQKLDCILCYTIYVIVCAFEFAGLLSQHLSCKMTDHIEAQESMINIVLRHLNVRNCYFYRFCLRNKKLLHFQNVTVDLCFKKVYVLLLQYSFKYKLYSFFPNFIDVYYLTINMQNYFKKFCEGFAQVF